MARQRNNRRGIVAAIVLIALLAPLRVSVAETNTFANEKYKQLLLTVAILNKAMQDAANNPMDDWRRENVQRAIGMLPPALVALANEYRNGTLDGKDFPQAYAVVARFVDQAAADGYRKFLRKPDRSLIPPMPPNFPKLDVPALSGGPSSSRTEGGRERLAIDESPGAQGIGTVQAPKNAALVNELVNLSSVKPAVGNGRGNERLSYDESASTTARTTGSRDGASPPVSPATSAAVSTPATWQSSSAAVRDAVRELSAIEARVGSGELRIRPAGDRVQRAPASLRRGDDARDEDENDGKVLESVGRDREQGLRRSVDPKAPKDGKKTSAVETPTSPFASLAQWSLRVARATVLPGLAFAEEGGGGEAAQLAAALLFGAAEVIKAVAPMIIANTQAEADKAIARMNADTQKYLTDQTANTSKYLADQQRDIAVFQSNLARTIAAEQQQNVNYRLDRQLAELKEARKDAEAVQTAIRNKEWEYNERRLRIAEEQAQKSYELAQEALKAQLTAAGLSTGYANSFDSGNPLTTSGRLPVISGVGASGSQAVAAVGGGFAGGAGPVGGASGLGASGQAASAAGAGGAPGSPGGGPNVGTGGAASSASGANGGNPLGNLFASAGARGAAGNAAGGSVLGDDKAKSGFQRLLAGVGKETDEEAGEELDDDGTGKDGRLGKHGLKGRRDRGLASVRAQARLKKDGKPVVAQPIAKSHDGKASDLIKFFGESKATTFATEAVERAEAKRKAN
jgi:hypothetical protein